VRLTDDELSEAIRVAESLHSLRLVAVCSELRERRAAEAATSKQLTMPALSEEDREALRMLANCNRCANGTTCTDALCTETMWGVAALDRLLAIDGGKGEK
jgi:hypothetical protein